MKTYLKYILVLFVVTSCATKQSNNTEENLSMGDMPNANTKYDTIYTINTPDNLKLIAALKSKLENAKFTLEERKSRAGLSYHNCEENRIVWVEGDGVREYFARRKKPEKGTAFYPDFVVSVYKFETNESATQNFILLDKALNSAGRFCNGKAPATLVMNGNEVFHLATRAEMFRTYIEKYGDAIKNFH